MSVIQGRTGQPSPQKCLEYILRAHLRHNLSDYQLLYQQHAARNKAALCARWLHCLDTAKSNKAHAAPLPPGLDCVVREVRSNPEDHRFESHRWQWSELTVRSDLLLTARSGSMWALIEFSSMPCYTGKTLCSQRLVCRVSAIQIPKIAERCCIKLCSRGYTMGVITKDSSSEGS
jgi:hypothetical protein